MTEADRSNTVWNLHSSHAVRKMPDGGRKKAKKSQDTELTSSETDAVMTGVVNQTDPEMMNKLADMSEEETEEEALRTVGQAISKQVPSIGRNATEKILSELKNSILERKNRRKTGEDEQGRLDEGRRGRRGGEDIEDDQWDDALGFGRYYGKTYSDVYRDDHQDSANKGLTKCQKLLRRVEEKTRDNMRKELEKRERERERERRKDPTE